MRVVATRVEPEDSRLVRRVRHLSRPLEPAGRRFQRHIAHGAGRRPAPRIAIGLPRLPVKAAARLERVVPTRARKTTHIAHPRVPISPYLEKYHAIGHVPL